MTATAKQYRQFARLEQAYETGTATPQQTDEYFAMLKKGFPNVGKQAIIERSMNRFVDTDAHSPNEMYYIRFC